MASNKEKWNAAQAYIKDKNYQAARKLLKEIDHPKAKELLATLPKSKTPILRYIIIGLIIVGIVALSITIPRFNQSIEDSNAASRDFFATQQSK